MRYATRLGELAAQLYKEALSHQRGRAGRTVKGKNISKHLHAAGEPKMRTKGVFAFPRGRSV